MSDFVDLGDFLWLVCAVDDPFLYQLSQAILDVKVRKFAAGRPDKGLEFGVLGEFWNKADEVDILKEDVIIDFISDHLPASLGEPSNLEVFIA